MKQKIIQLGQEGKSYSEIRKLLGCSLSTISYHLSPETRSKYKARQKRNRRRWLTDLKNENGGQCKCCGYNKCLDALDFHHTNPDNKIESVADLIGRAGRKVAKEEAKKCVLVCANCHREIHAGVRSLP